ncbi:MAG: histidine--tRNA ligase [Rickettsiales bacterium]|nr:histidine--tRNA ligase [Rickettsiales bacterium]
MSNQKFQNVRGTKDLFGDDILLFNKIIDIAKVKSLCWEFEELQTPIFEFSDVFERNLGEDSDIVSKEVYKFLDRGENYLTLRPEFTAAIVRSLIANGELSQIFPKKFFSYGPVFRYDRPQAGRQRQFNQINFEVFGEKNFYVDVDIILLAISILKDLKLLDQLSLQINSLGCDETKAKYEEALAKYLVKFKGELSDDSKVRLEKNPLRILDSKDKRDQEILKNAPEISNFYSDAARENFANILALLDKFEVKYEVNSRLVRGLDYYTSTVFEFITNDEKAQNTVLAGGRYDNLVAKMGGKNLEAIGFAAGIERLMLLSKIEIQKTRPIFVNYISESEKFYAFEIVSMIRNAGFNVEFCFSANFKKQLKRATQNNARFVVIIGEDEAKSDELLVKDFDNGNEQKVKKEFLLHYLEGK